MSKFTNTIYVQNTRIIFDIQPSVVNNKLKQKYAWSITNPLTLFNFLPKYGKYMPVGMIKDNDINGRVILPVNVDNSKLHDVFSGYKIEYKSNTSNTNVISPIKMTEGYDFRSDAQQESYNYLMTRKSSFQSSYLLNADVDTGKTYVILRYLQKTRKRMLYSIHKKSLYDDGIKGEISKFTDMEEGTDYCLLSGYDDLSNFLEEEDNEKYKIVVVMSLSLSNLATKDKGLYYNFCSLFDTFTIDEVHLRPKQTATQLLNYNFRTYIGLTATINENCKKYVHAFFGTNYFNGSEFMVKYRNILKVNMDIDFKVTHHKLLEDGKLHTSTFCERLFTVHKQELYSDIKTRLLKMLKVGHKVVIVIQLKKEIDYFLHNLIEDCSFDPYRKASLYEDLSYKELDDPDVVITTPNKIDAGSNMNINSMILTVTIADMSYLRQITGRVRNRTNNNNNLIVMYNYNCENTKNCTNNINKFIDTYANVSKEVDM